MKTSRNCIYIPSIDAKDLFLSNNFINKDNNIGYNLTNKNGDINYNRFINSLDFSLDSEKLRKIAKKVYNKKNQFSFMRNNKEYSDKIINVTFKFSSRTFNKIKKNTFIKFGFSYEEVSFIDNIAVIDNEIVGIITNHIVKNKTDLVLPRGFSYEETENGDYVYVENTVPVNKSRKELRDYLYENGFNCNGNHYVRFKRSSGSARVGKCLFIEESLYPLAHNWEKCGIEVADGDAIDLAAFESYISLPTSSAIDIININPKNILIIPDYDSVFEEDSVVVSMDENKRISVKEGPEIISNSIFDGQSLIDKSIMNDYDCYGMVLLRNRFFKSCCFNTNIQKWFADNNITELSQLHPDSVTLAKKIEDIKLITTPNSIKYVKFGTLKNWLKNIDSIFSVVKHEKKTHFFGGRKVQAHYQLLNTLQLTPDEIHQLLSPSLEYVNKLNTDVDVLKYHVECETLDEKSEMYISNVFKNTNELVYTMLNISDQFKHTRYFYNFKKELCKSYLKNMKKGHILIDGNYSVLFGNPYEMLLHSINQFTGETTLPVGCIHTKRYDYGKKILGCRSPHISTSNVLVSNNVEHKLIDEYFNLTNEIVCINAINENILERLSGADYDSDQMIVSDNEILINAALKNYSVFKVPANRVSAKKSKRYFTNKQKSDLDFKTSENKIGEIVNLSQELNSLMWDYINNSNKELKDCYDDIKDIYHDICILNVLSCIEIDKAKKEFEVSSTRELKQIKNKWLRKTFDNRTVMPAFLGFIAGTKGYRNSQKKSYDYHKTSMDYILKEINSRRSQKTNASDFIPFSKCFEFNGYNESSVNKRQLKIIVQLCETCTSAINAVWAKEYYETGEKFLLTNQYKNDLICDIQKLKINKHTMYSLICYVDNPKYSHISKILFDSLFNYEHLSIIDIMLNKEHCDSYIEECKECDCDLHLYDIPFARK